MSLLAQLVVGWLGTAIFAWIMYLIAKRVLK